MSTLATVLAPPEKAEKSDHQVVGSTFTWVLVIFGGLPFVVPVIFWLGEQRLSSHSPISWYFWMNALISSPHVYSTYVRLGRKVKEGNASRLLGLPAYASWAGVLGVAAYAGYFVQAMTAVNVWQSFHYLRQTYGVGCLLGRPRRNDWLFFLGYHLAFPAFILGRWDTLHVVWGGRSSPYLIPVDFTDGLLTFCWLVPFVGASFGVFSLRGLRPDARALAATNLAVYYGVHVFGFVSVSYFQRGFFAVTIYHAVQYLALVWLMERRKGVARSPWNAYVPNFAGFWLVIFLVGYGLDHHVSVAFNALWSWSSAVLLAAISAHHYTVDSVIWRRKAGA